MKKQFKAHPRFWISLAFSVLIMMCALSAIHDETDRIEFRGLLSDQSEIRPRIKEWDNAVRAYRRKNGALPKSLEQLYDGFPQGHKPHFYDLWGGPFVYKVVGNRYQIISYGRDGQPGGLGEDCDLSNDYLNPPVSHLSYLEFLTNPARMHATVASLICGIIAFLAGWATVGKLEMTPAGYTALAIKLSFTLVATLFITCIVVMLHVPSGH